MFSENDNKQWFALYTKPRHEFKAALQLEELSIEHYLPTVTKLKQWSDRKKKVTEPIFKGYIFIFANEKERIISVEQPTVIKTIFFNGKPAIIPVWQIENIKRMLSSTPDVFITNKVEVGEKIKVVAGPFMDVVGIVKYNSNDERILAVSVEMLNRSVLVKLPAESIVKFVES